MPEQHANNTVVLVTGATDGIGRETALALARRGARVIVHGRNEPKARAVAAEVAQAAGAQPFEPVVADLAHLSQARDIGRLLTERGLTPHVLLNNAGVYQRENVRSADGFEMTFAVNHLAPFALTHALLESPAGSRLRRIINVSSVAHTRGTLDLDDLSFERRGFDPYGTYAASKLANVVFTVELARRLRDRGITVNALHPGVVSTKLLTEGFGMQGRDSLAEGSATSVRLTLDGDLDGVTGAYFSNGAPAPMNPLANDAALARRFYELSTRLTGVSALPEP